MEEWRDIEGYEGIYQVSNEGRVKSLKYNKTHTTQYSRINITTLNISRGLYNTVSKDGAATTLKVCQELGISVEEPPFEIQLYDNGDYCQMYLRF